MEHATRLWTVSMVRGDMLGIATGDTTTSDALLDLGFILEYIPERYTPGGGTLYAEIGSPNDLRWLEAKPVPDAPLRGSEIVGAWVDEAAEFAETGELRPIDSSLPFQAVTLTQAEIDLIPENLQGTVIAIKSEWYRKGRDDAGTRAALASSRKGLMRAADGGIAWVNEVPIIGPAEEDPEGTR